MRAVNVVLLWHMHQPQYRDPTTGRYIMPWTRLHALKDYWGMVKIAEEFPGVHMTFNVVPSLGAQIDEYASGKFHEPWFDVVFAPADSLTPEQKLHILERGFQVNHDNLMARWPRYVELYKRVQSGGEKTAAAQFSAGEWRDLQLLSQLSWMDEEYLARDPIVSALEKKGKEFTEEDKAQLKAKQLELLARVLPEYRAAAASGQIEISTTPYYHPILPLVCDTEIALRSNPNSPVPRPPFRYPEDAREHLVRARRYHVERFGALPAGLWPSEGSVSDQALEIAAELGFRWFASDEGVLGRTRNIGFWRDAAGFPENAEQLYSPWRLKRGNREIVGFFRDHYVSDLLGFVYSRMSAQAAAEDLHRRIGLIGERWTASRTPTLSLILDGENAWEYYAGNGRDFLRQFYKKMEDDPDIHPLTATEAIAAAGEIPTIESIFPASWINANFDVWIGDAEDVRAWEMLAEAREVYARAVADAEGDDRYVPEAQALNRAFESILAAEGSDWFWWFGPEHSTANDAEFDALFRKHLTAIYAALGEEAPDSLSQPIKHLPTEVKRESPADYLRVIVDGRESTYFEWLGAGYYAAERRSTAMHGRMFVIDDLLFGFDGEHLYLRLDLIPEMLSKFQEFEIRITIWDAREMRLTLTVRENKLESVRLEQGGMCFLNPAEFVKAAFGKIVEASFDKKLFDIQNRRSLLLGVAIWEGGLPVDVLPGEGYLDIPLGDPAYAWPIE
ncbi:MAG TPA: glycoside hydrolase family 57 protein [Candidatus Acidoferrales bacterium]